MSRATLPEMREGYFPHWKLKTTGVIMPEERLPWGQTIVSGLQHGVAITLNLIKGLGGALLHEKIVASNSRRLAIIVDEAKLVDRLGMRACRKGAGSAFSCPVSGWVRTGSQVRT
jgi:hypothetical protein